MGVAWSQIFPPQAEFTDASIGSQKGKVFLVTGGYSGVGYHVARALYHAGGRVYIAGRSREKAEAVIESITTEKLTEENGKEDEDDDDNTSATSRGQLFFLQLNLDDLGSVKNSAVEFQSKESKLNVLFNNAGVSLPPAGSRSPHGHELQMATNCLGPFLLTQLLLPQLHDSGGGARVIWTSSQVVELSAPTGGIDLVDLATIPTDQSRNYTNSKTGNYFLASEFARRFGADGDGKILSVTTNPGGLKTRLLRHTSWLFRTLVSPLLYPAVNGAYTVLFAGLSETLSPQEYGGAYIIPWGRVHPGMRKDLLDALEDEGQGTGTGQAKKFWDWCEKEVSPYM